MEGDVVIKGKLKELGIEIDNLKAFILDYLRDIEGVISQNEAKQKAACEELEASEYTVSSIAEEIGMSRTTFYSYGHILQSYVELSASLSNKQNPLKQVEVLHDEIRDLKEQIDMMKSRDVNNFLSDFEVKTLRQKVAERDATISRLRSQLMEATQKRSG